MHKALLTEDFIQKLKNQPGMTWTPGIPKRFAKMSIQDIKSILLPLSSPKNVQHTYNAVFVNDAPDEFDSREKWPECVGQILDQASCGSCWAFSAVEPFGDRACIQKVDQKRIYYSEQYIVSCDTRDMGCQGGSQLFASMFLKKTGVPTAECMPYTSQEGNVEACPVKCVNGSGIVLKKVLNYRLHETYNGMMTEALNGPFQGQFFVFEDFMAYTGGIYQHTVGAFLGGHGITIVGYGVGKEGAELGIPYWIVKNSWGPDWGESGYFRIIRGENNSGFEMVSTGLIFV